MASQTEDLETNVEANEAPADAPSATLYLRGGAAGAVGRRQEALRDRFEGIADREDLADAEVERWATSVATPVSAPESDAAAAVAVYRDLEAAVDAAGGRLEPFFERQERRGGLLVGRPEGHRITFPVACLVIRREGDVTGLYPCWLEGTHHSVEDGLAALEAGDPENLQ